MPCTGRKANVQVFSERIINMIRSCKHIDITDIDTIKPWVTNCCYRHYRRYDFKRLFLRFGMDKVDYEECVQTKNKAMLNETINKICAECVNSIKHRKLKLSPVHIRKMTDRTTFKERQIGKESAMQQVYDYIAVYSSMEIFRRRMVYEQCSSLPNRGQVYGKNMICKWIRKDNFAKKYSKVHGYHYTEMCKYFVKLDIKQCYPTADLNSFLSLFRKDCANDDIVWLYETLLNSHHVGEYNGFMIGALPSQWACQYMLSFIYRFAKSLTVKRRDKKIRIVKHMCLFMDDMLLFGSSRKQLRGAVEQIINYTKQTFKWDIKPNYHIRLFNKFNIDMMGFIIRKDGSIGIRDRNFIHARRISLRHIEPFTVCQARRLLAYKGWFDNSNTFSVVKKYRLDKCFTESSYIISRFDKGRNHDENNRSSFWSMDASDN